MKLKDFFDCAIAAGMENDPRGTDEVAAELLRTRERYDALKEK